MLGTALALIGASAPACDPPPAAAAQIARDAPPAEFDRFRGDPRAAIVLATVREVEPVHVLRGFARPLVAERLAVALESVAWSGEASGAVRDAGAGAALEVVLHKPGKEDPPVAFGTLLHEQPYWFAIASDPDSPAYSLLAARFARPARFDPLQFLARYRGREDAALVECRVRRIERLDERERWAERADFDRVEFEIERVLWNHPADDPKEVTQSNALWKRPVNQLARDLGWFSSVRLGFGHLADGAGEPPSRSFFHEEHRYWLVLGEGFYKIQAIPLCAIEIRSDRDARPLDAFEWNRGDLAYLSFAGKVRSVTRDRVWVGAFTTTPSENVSVEVIELPWGADRTSAIDAAVGGTLEVMNVPTDEAREPPRLGELEPGAEYWICAVKDPDFDRPQVVAAYPR